MDHAERTHLSDETLLARFLSSGGYSKKLRLCELTSPRLPAPASDRALALRLLG